jgi:hypothetical protein
LSLDRLGGSAQTVRAGVRTTDAIDGLSISFDGSKSTGAQALGALSALGYDRFDVSSRCVQLADEANDRVSSEDCALEAADAFSLSSSYSISGVAAYMAAAAAQGVEMSSLDADLAAEALEPLTINSFELRLIDDSLVERALQAVAEQQSTTPDVIRQQATAMMAIGTLMAPPGAVQTLVGEAIAAVGEFLETPGSLRISIAPAEPVSIGALMTTIEAQDFDSAISMLNIEIAAE